MHAQWYFGDKLVFWIDPKLLRRRLLDRVSADGADFWLSDRFLDGADWSAVIRPVEDLAEHRDMLQLVTYGARYPEMPLFREFASRIRSGQPPKRYGKILDDEDKLHAYFRYFLQLADNIREHGFQQQSALPTRPAEGVEVRGRWAARQRNIGVAIASNGEVLRFLGGRHRTAIAQALSLPAVAVEVRLVHAGWLTLQMIRRGHSPAEALLEWIRARPSPALAGGEGSSQPASENTVKLQKRLE